MFRFSCENQTGVPRAKKVFRHWNRRSNIYLFTIQFHSSCKSLQMQFVSCMENHKWKSCQKQSVWSSRSPTKNMFTFAMNQIIMFAKSCISNFDTTVIKVSSQGKTMSGNFLCSENQVFVRIFSLQNIVCTGSNQEVHKHVIAAKLRFFVTQLHVLPRKRN